jgi:protease-4
MRRSFLRLFGLLVLFVGVALGGRPAPAQEMASHYETTDLLGAPPASFREGLLGSANPAVPALTGNQFVAAWTTDGRDATSVEDWGLFTSVGGLGASVLRRTRGPLALTGYHLSLAGGTEAGAFGIGYQGYAGDATALGRYNRLTAGTVARPSPYLSVGLTGRVSLETDDREVVGELGVRPLGTSRLTLFADAAWGEGEALRDAPWSAGAAVEVIPGLDLRGRVFDSEAVSVGLRLELGRFGLDSESRVDAEGDYARQVNRVRLGRYEPSAIVDAARAGEAHVALSTEGAAAYQEGPLQRLGGLLGSDEPSRFYELLRTVRRAGESDRVRAIALNLSDLQMRPEQVWELRTALRTAQQAGTTVVAVLEGGGMTAYHLASVADRVALDPEGTLTLPGYALSRTFLKGTLDKLGLGYQSWRFFEYKSARETLTRTRFSPADSLQRQQYVNDRYDLFVDDVTRNRPLGPDSLDRLIDEKTLLRAQEALAAGLVDTLARWPERQGLLTAAAGGASSALDVSTLDQIATASRDWGAREEVALVYGIGPTSVESGMKSRELSKKIRDLAGDGDVAAIVFRVDSPGGSPVAADQVGEAVKHAATKKPVVVSQGQVAGSGGYWVSAYADTILAGPNTVTGSIGVIGGWLYDKGFREKTGLSSDVVFRGERAGLFGGGAQVPLVGLSVPSRKLNEEELARIETLIRQGYDRFVATVAEGRDTTEAHIRNVGEGRIYSGLDGKDVGLVDEIGGLPRAIELAREAAGLTPAETTVREVNPTAELSLGSLLPGPLAILASVLDSDSAPTAPTPNTPVGTFLRLTLDNQPRPLVLLPPSAQPQTP